MNRTITKILLIISACFFLIIGVELYSLYSLNRAVGKIPVTLTKEIMQEKFSTPPKMSINTSKKYIAYMDTSFGKITIELFAHEMPITVNNFVYLAQNNFYENAHFSRVIKGFMIQGGELTNPQLGDVAYSFKNEPFKGSYVRGAVAMANAAKKNGSQFFIIQNNYSIPPDYPIFGRVIEGMDVVDAIANIPLKEKDGELLPVDPVKILSVKITEK